MRAFSLPFPSISGAKMGLGWFSSGRQEVVHHGISSQYTRSLQNTVSAKLRAITSLRLVRGLGRRGNTLGILSHPSFVSSLLYVWEVFRIRGKAVRGMHVNSILFNALLLNLLVLSACQNIYAGDVYRANTQPTSTRNCCWTLDTRCIQRRLSQELRQIDICKSVSYQDHTPEYNFGSRAVWLWLVILQREKTTESGKYNNKSGQNSEKRGVGSGTNKNTRTEKKKTGTQHEGSSIKSV